MTIVRMLKSVERPASRTKGGVSSSFVSPLQVQVVE